MLSEADAGPNQASVVDGPLELFKLLAPDLAVPSKKRPGCSRQCLAFRQECDGNPVQAPGREYPIVKIAAKGGSQG